MKPGKLHPNPYAALYGAPSDASLSANTLQIPPVVTLPKDWESCLKGNYGLEDNVAGRTPSTFRPGTLARQVTPAGTFY